MFPLPLGHTPDKWTPPFHACLRSTGPYSLSPPIFYQFLVPTVSFFCELTAFSCSAEWYPSPFYRNFLPHPCFKKRNHPGAGRTPRTGTSPSRPSGFFSFLFARPSPPLLRSQNTFRKQEWDEPPFSFVSGGSTLSGLFGVFLFPSAKTTSPFFFHEAERMFWVPPCIYLRPASLPEKIDTNSLWEAVIISSSFRKRTSCLPKVIAFFWVFLSLLYSSFFLVGFSSLFLPAKNQIPTPARYRGARSARRTAAPPENTFVPFSRFIFCPPQVQLSSFFPHQKSVPPSPRCNLV